MASAFINFQKRNFEEALKSYNWLFSKDETNLNSICKVGHCYFMLKKFAQAEESYIKAIRVASFSG